MPRGQEYISDWESSEKRRSPFPPPRQNTSRNTIIDRPHRLMNEPSKRFGQSRFSVRFESSPAAYESSVWTTGRTRSGFGFTHGLKTPGTRQRRISNAPLNKISNHEGAKRGFGKSSKNSDRCLPGRRTRDVHTVPRVITALNDYNIAMELRVWLSDEQRHIAARHALRETLFETLRTPGVDMPYETLSLSPVTLLDAKR